MMLATNLLLVRRAERSFFPVFKLYLRGSTNYECGRLQSGRFFGIYFGEDFLTHSPLLLTPNLSLREEVVSIYLARTVGYI